MTEPRQETLSLVEQLVQEVMGQQRQDAISYIACGVDNYIDSMLENEDRLPPEPTSQTVTDAIADSAGGDEITSPHPYIQGMASENY